MRHLTEGALRRMYDDPNSIEEDFRAHFAGCTACQARFGTVAGDARSALALLEVPGVTVDPRSALTRLRPRLPEGRRAGLAGLGRLPALGWRKPAAAGALAAGLVAVMAFTPLASNVINLLQPQQIQPITLSQQDLNSLAPLGAYGQVKWQSRPNPRTVSSAADAATASGLAAIRPGTLPRGIAGQPVTYEAFDQGTASFTFSEAKARAAAQRAGNQAPSFPPGVDGSTLVVKSGPGEAAVYGDMAGLQQAAKSSQDPQAAVQQAGSVLAIGEMKAPSVYSTGISLDQFKQVLLAQPGLTPQARNAIESLGGPQGTLPIPIPMDQASAHPVSVQGVQGTALGDNTGLGAAVVWIKHGVVYFVGGTVSQNDALAVANSLA